MDDPNATIAALNKSAMPQLHRGQPPPQPPPASSPPVQPPSITPPAPPAGDPPAGTPPAEPSIEAPPPIPDAFMGVPPAPGQPPNQPATPPAPTPTADDDLKAIDTSRWSEGQRRAFERYKAREAEARKKAEDLEKRVAEMQAKIGQPDPTIQAKLAELDAFQKRAHEAETELAKMDIQRDPQFQAMFVEPRNAKLNQLRSGLKAFGIDEKLAESLETMSPDQRLTTLSKAVPAEKQGFIGAIVGMIATPMSELDDIRARKEQALSRASEQRQSWEAQRNEQIKQFRQQHVQGALEAIVKEGHFEFAHLDNAPQWNAFSAMMRTQVQRAVESQDPQQTSRLIAKGVGADYLLKMLKTVDAENKALKASLAKMSQASPRPGGGTPPAAPPNQPNQAARPEDIFKVSLRKAAEAMGRQSPI